MGSREYERFSYHPTKTYGFKKYSTKEVAKKKAEELVEKLNRRKDIITAFYEDDPKEKMYIVFAKYGCPC